MSTPKDLCCCTMPTSRLGSGNGSGRSITACTTVKIAVFAPMPSASVSTAAMVNPGARRSMRLAYWISWRASLSQRNDRASR